MDIISNQDVDIKSVRGCGHFDGYDQNGDFCGTNSYCAELYIKDLVMQMGFYIRNSKILTSVSLYDICTSCTELENNHKKSLSLFKEKNWDYDLIQKIVADKIIAQYGYTKQLER